jgi:hypothetical protein
MYACLLRATSYTKSYASFENVGRLKIVVSRPRFGYYSPVGTGSAGQAPGGKKGRTYIYRCTLLIG